MADPWKADAIGRLCNQWWLAVPHGLVRPEEVPPTWGVMELTANGLRVRRQAPAREPEPATKGFLAAMMRRAFDFQSAHIAEEVERRDAAREERMKREVEQRVKGLAGETAALAKWKAGFEAAYGKQIVEWRDPAQFAHLLRLAESIDKNGWGPVESMVKAAKDTIKTVDEARSALDRLRDGASERTQAEP